MSNFDSLPDDATRLGPADLRSQFTDISRHPTLIGWIGRYALLVLLFGGGAAFFSLFAPVLVALLD